MNILESIQKKLTFGMSAEQEDHFRQVNFGADVTQARIFILLIILPFMLLVVNDQGFFGFSRMFYGLLAFRLAMVAYTILFFKSLRGLQNYRSYDRAEFFWGLSLALTQITINMTRPEDFIAHTVAIVLNIFVVAIAIPNRFTNQIILSLVYTVGQTLVIVPNLWILPQAFFTVFLNMSIATAIAIISSWLLHFWRRQEFLTREEVQKARVEIEAQLTKRKKAEEELAKIVIVRKQEIHHRIKNNLQVISSLLDLQAETFRDKECIKDSEVLKAFRESQNRVISMALIHEELYKGGGFETLNFSPYIEELTVNLLHAYSVGNTDLSINMDLVENAFFDMDTAVPLGMIVNELVSNSLKHAFKGRDRGEIQIKLSREENEECIKCINEDCSTAYVLSVSDNGVGIPKNLEIEDLNSLGMQLVVTLVDQLDGKFELKSNSGTEFAIRFTVTEEK